MNTYFRKIRLLTICLVCSILAHIFVVYALRLFGTYDFSAPVSQPPGVTVELAKSTDAAPAEENAEKQENDAVQEDDTSVKRPLPVQEDDGSTVSESEPEPAEMPIVRRDKVVSPQAEKATAGALPAGASLSKAASQTPPPLKAGDFLGAQFEKLTYQITMLGIPIGNAELEAKYENGETSITLRVKSNAAISSVFPVDDVVETRHLDGRFIMTNVKQREGDFRSDEMFAINPGKKSVSWMDNIRGRSLKMPLPTDDVLDTLSGIYYLRKRQLQVGRTETLHIYDSETYADVPVEILSREEMRLPNLTKVNALVVRPLQKTAGIFRRTGDVLIWMTDDDHKVPVKIVTSIALGKVTADLVSAESKPFDAEPKDTSRLMQHADTTPPRNGTARR
ncbi:MAG TPA: DUF3108 domain-containing protein [Desulfuromonadaceae bacterium]